MGRSLGLKFKQRTAIIESLKQGLPVSSFEHLSRTIGIPLSKLATVTNIALRTLARRKEQGHLGMAESERVYRVAALFEKASDVFDSEEQARQWLTSPKKTLAGNSPLEYAETAIGAREVEDLLGRLEYGVFS